MRIVISLSLVVVFAGLVLSGCGGHDRASGPAVVYVRQERSGPPFIEGSFSYVRVVNSEGKLVLTKRLSLTEPVEHVALRLDAGEYRLVSFQRIWSGNCGLLEPPSYRCDYPLEVGGETLALVVRLDPRSGCEIESE